MQAPPKLIQSKKTIFTFPLLFSKDKISITKQIPAVNPVTHAPGPALSEIWPKNPVNVRIKKTSQEKMCGLVFPDKISRI